MSDAKKFRVWWVPQMPCASFQWPVESIAEGAKVMAILAEYDDFQFKNRIKGDYCNAGGVQQLEDDGEWWEVDDDELARATEPYMRVTAE